MFAGGHSLQEPEESLGRNRAHEPLEQFACSLSAVVNLCKFSQKHFKILTVSTVMLIRLEMNHWFHETQLKELNIAMSENINSKA